ncbi:MAG: DUF1499 domain-containing protein [Pseudomonadota bacterium]
MRILFLVAALLLSGMILLSLLSRRGKAKGLVDGRLAPLPGKPNCVSSEAGTDPAKAVAPLATDKNALLGAIEATGGTVMADRGDYIAATYTSGLMRFVDDVEFRQDGDIWHVRSASRVGHSDLGANRKRVAAIRSVLET